VAPHGDDAPDENDPPSPSARETYSITKPALDFYYDRAQGHFARFNNMSVAFELAGRELKARIVKTGRVFDLKPLTAIERFLKSHALRTRDGAPQEAPDVAARRRDWDEAKRSGDAGAMTTTANALMRAVEEARGYLNGHETVPAAGRDGAHHPTSEILNPLAKDGSEIEAVVRDRLSPALPTTKWVDATGAVAYRVPDRDEAVVDGTAERGLPDKDPTADKTARDGGDAGKHLTVLAMEQAKAVAAAITGAPPERQAGMLGEIKERLGETIAAQVAAQFPKDPSVEAATTIGGAAELGDRDWWVTAWDDFWRWVAGGGNRGGQSPLPEEDYEVEQESDTPVGSQLTDKPMDIQRDERESPLDPNWSPSKSRYDPPREWRQFRRPRPANPAKAPPHKTTPFAQTERGKVLIGIDELDPIRKAQFRPEIGSWTWPTSYPPTQKQLTQGFGYFGAPRGRKGAFHGGLDFHADPDPNKETQVRMPTGARLTSVKESFYDKVDANGQSVRVSTGYTLRFDLGNGVVLELLHVKPTEEMLLLQAELASGGGRSSRFIPRGSVIGFVDRDAYEGRNDHVHLQITMQRGRMSGQTVSGFAIDPTELFDWNQPERNREGGGLLP
jgi:hypothetical protein